MVYPESRLCGLHELRDGIQGTWSVQLLLRVRGDDPCNDVGTAVAELLHYSTDVAGQSGTPRSARIPRAVAAIGLRRDGHAGAGAQGDAGYQPGVVAGRARPREGRRRVDVPAGDRPMLAVGDAAVSAQLGRRPSVHHDGTLDALDFGVLGRNG